MKESTGHHSGRTRLRIIALVCTALCALDLIDQAALALTHHHGLYGGPVAPAIGLAGGLLHLAMNRRQP